MDSGKLRSYALDLFFPNRCPLCGKAVGWDTPYENGCFDALPRTGEEFCHACGHSGQGCICGRAGYRKRAFERCYAAFYYEDIAKKAVLYLKDTKNDIFPYIAAEKLCCDMAEDNYGFRADIVVPVPMTREKLVRKGYNHAELIADAVGKIMNLPVKTDAIVKRYSFSAQHTLSADMREENADKKYFAGNPDGIAGKTVIICDDVMTTGSTLNKCAMILKEMGAAGVIAAAAASAK